ncbi:hypothetical protein D3C78_1233380 [compost metagenome]
MLQGGDELVELLEQAVEQQQVAGKAVDHPLHHPVHLRQQAAFVAFAAIQHAGLGHAVEQAPRRMMVLGEQRLVLQRHLQVGRMQVRQGGLAGVRQVVIVEDEVEQHADQIDHVGFLVRKLLLAGPLAMGFQLLLQIGLEPFDGLRTLQTLAEVVARLLLQAVQGVEQFAGAVGAGGGARGEAGNATRAAEQRGIGIAFAAFAEQRGQAAEQLGGVLGWRAVEVRGSGVMRLDGGMQQVGCRAGSC